MELLLNLVWTTLAIGAVAAYFTGSRQSARRRPLTHAQALCVLGCCLLLLFPIISASDDLHPTVALAEDAVKRGRCTPATHVASCHSPLSCIPSAAAAFVQAPSVQVGGYVGIEPEAPLPAIAAPPQDGRAPPSRV